jgi:hypothetical protein
MADAQVQFPAEAAAQLNVAQRNGRENIGDLAPREASGSAARVAGQQSQQGKDVAAADGIRK